MEARILPGFVSTQGGRALLVVRGLSQAPLVLVRAAAGDQPVVARAELLRSGTAFDHELIKRKLWTYRIDIHGPIPGAVCGVEASVNGERVFNAIPVVPEQLPPEGLTIAAATCFYDYFPTNGSSTYRHQLVHGRWFSRPRFKILAGDNLYVDVAPGQLFRRGGFNETCEYYARYYSESEYAAFLAGEGTVTTWDDHEFWNNYPEEQAHLSRTRGGDRKDYIAAAHAALDLFQTPLNPPPVVPGGRSYSFDIAPLSFFVADVRSRRSLHAAGDRRFMLEAEHTKLLEWLRGLKNPGVLVLGQPLWSNPGDKRDWCLPAFERQYAQIWQGLADAAFDVLVVSGDVHFSRALEIGVGRGFVYEVITSPAVHIPSIPTIALSSLGFNVQKQDRGSLSLGRPVQIDPRYGVKPRVTRFLTGHDEPNTFALLNFRGSAERVQVGLAFVDHSKPATARCKEPGAVFNPCHSPEAFSLRRRPS